MCLSHACFACLLCIVAQSCPTLCSPMDCNLPGSSVHGDSPGKNTNVGCHCLLQGIFLTQGLNLHLLHWQADFFLPLSNLNITLQKRCKEQANWTWLICILMKTLSVHREHYFLMDKICISFFIDLFVTEKAYSLKQGNRCPKFTTVHFVLFLKRCNNSFH